MVKIKLTSKNIPAIDAPMTNTNGTGLRCSDRLRRKRASPDPGLKPRAHARSKSTSTSTTSTTSSCGSIWNVKVPICKKPKVANAAKSLLKVNSCLPSHQSKPSLRGNSLASSMPDPNEAKALVSCYHAAREAKHQPRTTDPE